MRPFAGFERAFSYSSFVWSPGTPQPRGQSTSDLITVSARIPVTNIFPCLFRVAITWSCWVDRCHLGTTSDIVYQVSFSPQVYFLPILCSYHHRDARLASQTGGIRTTPVESRNRLITTLQVPNVNANISLQREILNTRFTLVRKKFIYSYIILLSFFKRVTDLERPHPTSQNLALIKNTNH